MPDREQTRQKLIEYFLILDFVWICAVHQVKNLSFRLKACWINSKEGRSKMPSYKT